MTSRYEELLMPEQRDRVVEKVVTALKTQGKLPTKTLNDFRDLFKAGKPFQDSTTTRFGQCLLC